MADWFLDQYKNLELSRTDLTYGDSLSGSTRLLAALSKLFAKYFNPLTPVLAEHMICGVGVSACLDQLCGKICDDGDTIMMSVPYYSGRVSHCLPTAAELSRKMASTVILALAMA